jgi:tetratricopeptide (TPR) repeat protein
VPALFHKGECHRELGEVDEEIAAYRAALNLAPDFFGAMFAIGAAWAIKHGAPREEIRYIEPGDRIDLQDPEHLFYLGLSNLALGMHDLARELIQSLRQTAPNLADRLEAIAEIAADQNDFDKGQTRT